MTKPPSEQSTANDVFERLWAEIGLKSSDLAGPVVCTGADPIVPSIHRVGAASAGALAAEAAAIAAIWKMRGGEEQEVSIDVARAVVPGLQTVAHLHQRGHHLPPHPRGADLTGFFRTADDRRIFLLRTTAYTDILLRQINVLGCAYDAPAVAATVARWKALDLEEALAERKAVGVIARTRDEWLRHPQGRWLAARPPVEIQRIGNSAPEPLSRTARPLGGIRVLDFSHVLAGPATARLLAEQGAEVLHISPPWRIDNHAILIDTGFGKRSALLDLERDTDSEQLNQLVKRADLFVQSWRPGALERVGFGAEDVAAVRPGIIYVSVSCYGSGGPWRERGGFEPIGQTACGLAIDEGNADEPRLAPTGTMNDYLVAYLAGAGALAALIRRSREGGSYHVRVSLTRASMFLQELGTLSTAERSMLPTAVPAPDPAHFVTMSSPYGDLRVPAPVARFGKTEPYWDRAPVPPGHDAPSWDE